MEDKWKKLCELVKKNIDERQYGEAYEKIIKAMAENPDSAIPHNLLGIYYEKQKQHVEGMKHFRAAWALDPTFIPARFNLDFYGSFDRAAKTCAYLESDVPQEIKKPVCRIVYDDWGIGHVVKE